MKHAEARARNAEIVKLAQELDEKGYFKYSYRDLARKYGVAHPLITRIARAAGIPPRPLGQCGRGVYLVGQTEPRWRCPKSLRPLRDLLMRKLGNAREVAAMVRDHARIRGIVE